MSERTTIAFVDDEPQVLAGLRDLLHRRRSVWDMSFHTTAEDALERIAQTPLDVIVSDVRMPGTDGLTLLQQLRDEHPDIVRVILSGQIGNGSVVRATSLAHACLGKPCDPTELATVIDRVLETRDLLDRDGIAIRAAGVTELPLVSTALWELRATITRSGSGAEDIARVVAQDVALAARVLAVVNSAGYGLPRHITALEEAVAFLGMSTVEAIALAHAAQSMAGSTLSPGWLTRFERHSTSVATRARKLVARGMSPDTAFAGGLLHDVGQLVLATADPAGQRRRSARAADEGRILADVEFEELQCTHATVGGHLLSFWALPPVLVDAVARHHEPDLSRLGPVARAVAAAESAERVAERTVERPAPGR